MRGWVKELYAERGRPSIDPGVFFKLQLVMFCEVIRSERKLIEIASLNLAHRWYLGYALDEALPDHSSLTRIQQRLGVDLFQRFFKQIVDLCQEAGLVWAKDLYFDGTKVEANADFDSLDPRFFHAAKTHLGDLFPDSTPTDDSPSPVRDLPPGILQRPTDPEATPMRTGARTTLGDHDHDVVDGGKRHITLAAFVMPADVTDNMPVRDLLWRVCFRRNLRPHHVTGDAKYGTIENVVAIEDAGIRA